jgi:protein CpxP
MNPTGRSSRPFLLASALLFASVAVAAAQTAPPPPEPQPPGWGHHGDHRKGPQDWQAEQTKMEERRLAALHTKLDLKPPQEPGWQAFVTGLQAARPAPEPHEKPDWQTVKMETAPERLDHMLGRIDDMRAHLAQLDQVVKTFYAGLSKDQQTIFDDNFKAMGPPHGGPGGWERHGMGHGPMGRGGPMGPLPMGPPGGQPPQG